MKEKLQAALKAAMKSRQQIRMDTIRSLLSELQYAAIHQQAEELSGEESLAVLQREVKKRRETIELAEKGGRPEAKDRLLQEIAIIEEFLPQQLSTHDLEKIITALKSENPALNMGAAMKLLKEKFSGQYDGKAASEVAKRLLG